ncbi:MAG: tryptophan-rich sensory protein [Simkaniaceae bacterium]|nr:tryptophan-rich sensory protein [Simkaniaceae bacterium]MCF7852402.1 tryptophan-rich sensory protein [Simkaniaceae bacterium]
MTLKNSTKQSYIKHFIIWVIVIMLVQWAGSLFTDMSVKTWYQSLHKPSWTPPNILFPIVWPILYLSMAFAITHMRFKQGRYEQKWLTPFLVQLSINLSWSFLFFSLRSPLLGFIGVVLLIISLLWTMIAFFRTSKCACFVLIPYLGWVIFATILNASILVLN